MQPGLDQEQALWVAGYRRLAGLDEAGRGAWAGPVVAAAVVLPADVAIAQRLAGVMDSKQLSPRQRERLYPLVEAEAAAVGVGIVAAERIDADGILPATRQAMRQAVLQIDPPPDFLLIDHVRLQQLPISQRSLVKGDAHVLSIAAASIIAKVTRDRLMRDFARSYPAYQFDRNMGYGTASHRAALDRVGPCPIHRRSFRPVRGRQMSLSLNGQPVELPATRDPDHD